jgi:hypothetical protein
MLLADVVSLFQNPASRHPKANSLGLTGERIMGMAVCNIRASVFTESGKVCHIYSQYVNVKFGWASGCGLCSPYSALFGWHL